LNQSKKPLLAAARRPLTLTVMMRTSEAVAAKG
jgi:hypothetical protein